ncbi:hypothetical protein Sjap_021443 [Stephania japonica]|uniref:Uncharacterized protein n=1 Tax=Stephania japonica TaxID=461633 RepID=A0AAP0ELZ6_9MAGN
MSVHQGLCGYRVDNRDFSQFEFTHWRCLVDGPKITYSRLVICFVVTAECKLQYEQREWREDANQNVKESEVGDGMVGAKERVGNVGTKEGKQKPCTKLSIDIRGGRGDRQTQQSSQVDDEVGIDTILGKPLENLRSHDDQRLPPSSTV